MPGLVAILMLVVGGRIFWCILPTPAPLPKVEPLDAGPPPPALRKAAPRWDGGRGPVRKPDAGVSRPYDDAGLVDNGVAGAPRGWRPWKPDAGSLTPPGGGVPSDAGGGS